jgi:hypothetical protein
LISSSSVSVRARLRKTPDVDGRLPLEVDGREGFAFVFDVGLNGADDVEGIVFG